MGFGSAGKSGKAVLAANIPGRRSDRVVLDRAVSGRRSARIGVYGVQTRLPDSAITPLDRAVKSALILLCSSAVS